VEKFYAARKYQRNSREKRKKEKLLKAVTSEYEELVADIKRLRLKNKNPDKQVRKLNKIKKKQRKMKKIAYAQTSFKKVGCALLDGLQAIIEYMKTARDVVGEEMLKFLLDLFATLYNIYKCPEWDSLLVNMTSFFSRHFPTDYANYAICWLKAAFEVAFSQDDKTSYKDLILGLFTNSADFLDDKLWDNITTFFLKISALYACVTDAVSLEAIDIEVIVKQFKKFKAQLPEVKDVIEMVFMCYEFVLGNWEKIRTGDWSVFILGKDETQQFEVEVRVLEQAFPFVIANKEVELKDRFNLTKKEFESRLGKAIKTAKSLISRCTSTQQRMSVSNFVRSLTDKQSQLYASVADAPRKLEAYSIKFAGPSGTGKSTLLDMCSRIVLHAYKHDPNERGQVVFTNISEKFESTIFPSHKVICADDVANNKNEKPNYDRILNYVNTVPRPLEKADTKEKGIYYPGNDAFLATTNDETLRAIECSACAESILRRFALDVTVEARDEYKNSYGGLIKFDKPRYDVYKLTLKRFSHIETDEETGKKEIVWEIINRDEWNKYDDEEHDFAAMCSFIAKDVKRHIAYQKEKAKAQKELDECEFCYTCGCPSVVCTCDPDPTCKCCETFPCACAHFDELNDGHYWCETCEKKSEGEDEFCTVCNDSIAVCTCEPQTDCKCCGENKCKCDHYNNLNKGHKWCDTCNNLSDKAKSILDSVEDEDKDAVALFGSPWSAFSTAELWDYRAAISGCTTSMKKLYKDGALYAKVWRYRNELKKHILALFGSVAVAALISHKLAIMTISFSTLRLYQLYHRMVVEVDTELENRLDRLSSLCEGVRDHLRSNITKYFALGASIIALYKSYTVIKPLLFVQDKSSFFDEKTEIFERILDCPKGNAHRVILQDEKDYKEGYSRLTPKETKVSKTTTSADLQLAIAKALRVVIVKSRGEVYGTVNGIMVASNVILIPSHVVPDVYPIDIETSTTPGVPSAKTKDQKLTEEYCYVDRERDFALIHLASSPASTNFAQFFPEEYPEFRTRATTVLWKSPDNRVVKSEQPARQLAEDLDYYGYLEKPGLLYGTKQTVHRYTLKKGTGLKVNLDFKGFGGLCGAPYIDSSKGIIYGFHVAGYVESHRGYLTCLTQPLLREGLAKLDKTSPTLLVHSASEVKVDTYDTPYTVVNDKPLYTREDGTQDKTVVTFIGKVLKDGQPLESRARTPYIPTPFKGVSESFGANKHKPPKKPNDVSKSMATLNKLTNPVQHYEGDILLKAIEDYQEHTLQAIRDNREECKDMLRIYSHEEAMDGIGEFGLGGCPNDTSAGFPIGKSKKQCLKRDPMDESLVQIPREFNDKYDIQKEIDRTEDCWRTGYRSEAIYKASSKVNELLPNKKADEKVRKFYGSGFANFIASRKALAGVPRFMRKFWRKTECLVGIEPTSREWEELYQHLTKHSIAKMIAGDFSGFDTRMAAQITSAAAKIIVSWYKEVGCTDEELALVRGALSDIIHPNILFEGDLYRFANGNPSGNLITVQLNSICNSLMMRYVYYALNRSVKEKFAENVSLATYGDDNAMSVKDHCKWFTHTACQEEFEKLDIGYTMADKGAKSVPYIPIEEISFLKRNFVKHETLNKIVAPIEEDSILKKFFWVKKPTETPLSFAEQFGAYTDGSFREAYLHGKAYYEKFTEKIQAIIAKNPELKAQVSIIPYSEMTQVLQPYYHDDYKNNNKKLFMESCVIDSEDATTCIET
jgi:energy-coupling factor transporter ATP-binding protein EcfA2